MQLLRTALSLLEPGAPAPSAAEQAVAAMASILVRLLHTFVFPLSYKFMQAGLASP